MNHFLGCGTSSGDLNTGGNLSESSFLEALFGLELGHADFADDADFSSLLFVCPTDFTEFHRSLPYAGWDFADFADDADFSSLLFISPTDFTEFHRSLPYAGWDFADNADDAVFFCSSSITHHDLRVKIG